MPVHDGRSGVNVVGVDVETQPARSDVQRVALQHHDPRPKPCVNPLRREMRHDRGDHHVGAPREPPRRVPRAAMARSGSRTRGEEPKHAARATRRPHPRRNRNARRPWKARSQSCCVLRCGLAGLDDRVRARSRAGSPPRSPKPACPHCPVREQTRLPRRRTGRAGSTCCPSAASRIDQHPTGAGIAHAHGAALRLRPSPPRPAHCAEGRQATGLEAYASDASSRTIARRCRERSAPGSP